MLTGVRQLLLHGITAKAADTGRRRQRVLAALAQAAKDGSEISVTAVARRAGVDRTFLYRHRDLLGQVHAQAAEPPTVPGGRGPTVSRASLQADLLATDARTARLAAHVRRLEARLSDVLGEQVWRESGIGGPDDTEQLKARINTLEQQVVDLEIQLQDQGDDLAAARAANRADGAAEPSNRLTAHSVPRWSARVTRRPAVRGRAPGTVHRSG
ncbi:hypothetical protein AB0D27_43160 [Streptomyces sp. NPDC048415]|uniref:hypothetical protein n=1 Tax=Streptomyces sp. NPDC048415 TaxID=3154822 RepID=UPI0034320788